MRFRKKVLALALMGISLNAYAGTFQGGLKVDRIWIAATNIVFGFTTSPTDCLDLAGYYGGHATIETTNPLYKEQLSLLLTAKTSGKSVDIWYTDLGDCKSHNDMLKVNTIGISHGQ